MWWEVVYILKKENIPLVGKAKKKMKRMYLGHLALIPLILLFCPLRFMVPPCCPFTIVIVIPPMIHPMSSCS
jgi:hypothetical protein